MGGGPWRREPTSPVITVQVDFVVLHPVMWMFLAVLVTFLLTRTVTRRIRANERAAEIRARAGQPVTVAVLRNISLGGVHVHHQVFGILLMSAIGIIMFATTPSGVALNVCAALFGVGLSLAFDEFAMWLHLDDVYWTTEGRQSVDAIFCVLVITGILIGGADFVTGQVGTAAWWSSVVGLLLQLFLAVVCLLKGKVMTGVIGMVFFPVVAAGALRLGKPRSWWARRYYPDRPRRTARSRRRFGPGYDQRWNRVRDFFGGSPNPSPITSEAPATDPLAIADGLVEPDQRTTVGRGPADTPPRA